MNKCEELKIVHAWISEDSLISVGFGSNGRKQTCANCGLVRFHCSELKEWWGYDDGRPNEPIYNIRPV